MSAKASTTPGAKHDYRCAHLFGHLQSNQADRGAALAAWLGNLLNRGSTRTGLQETSSRQERWRERQEKNSKICLLSIYTLTTKLSFAGLVIKRRCITIKDIILITKLRLNVVKLAIQNSVSRFRCEKPVAKNAVRTSPSTKVMVRFPWIKVQVEPRITKRFLLMGKKKYAGQIGAKPQNKAVFCVGQRD